MWLIWAKSFSFIQQYLNILRILHLELGYANPLKDNYGLEAVLSGVKRGKGVSQNFQFSLTDLQTFEGILDTGNIKDIQLWEIVVSCSFGLL